MPENLSLRVAQDEAGNRLDLFLSRTIAGVSRTAIQEWIKTGSVSVNGRPSKPSYELRPGDRLEVIRPEPEPTYVVPEDIALNLVFEDEYLLVVDKPAGMVVHPGAGVKSGTLANALVHHLTSISREGSDRPGIVHRLDKDTSGLLVVAKNEAIHDHLARQFQRREVEKHYLALVYGRIPTQAGTISAPLGRDIRSRTKISTRTRKPRQAVTEYLVLRRYASFTHLKVILHTGRTHQIRVHMEYVKHPIVGDETYGGKPRGFLRDTPLIREIENLGRHFLHAAHLAFEHPVRKERLQFDSPLPVELAQLLNRLE